MYDPIRRISQRMFDVVCEHADDDQEMVLNSLAAALRRELGLPEPEIDTPRSWDF